MSQSTRWQDWLRNGRLASLAAGLVFIAWLTLITTWDDSRPFPNEFTLLTMAMMGGAFTNIMVTKQKQDATTAEKVVTLQGEMVQQQDRHAALDDRTTASEGRHAASERRATDSEERESEWSQHRDHDEDGHR